jgi:hypothetical protein
MPPEAGVGMPHNLHLGLPPGNVVLAACGEVMGASVSPPRHDELPEEGEGGASRPAMLAAPAGYETPRWAETRPDQFGGARVRASVRASVRAAVGSAFPTLPMQSDGARDPG